MAVWRKPCSGFVKVNCKGVFDRCEIKCAVACVMRNSRGAWVGGSAGMMGLNLPLGAELWSIYYGLKLAWETSNTSVIVEVDSEEAVIAVNDPNPEFWLANLVGMIKMLLSEAWDACVITHIPTSANGAATALASTALGWDGGLNGLSSPPSSITSVLAADIANAP